MCSVCGCGEGETRIERANADSDKPGHGHDQQGPHGHGPDHHHHHHDHDHGHAHHHHGDHEGHAHGPDGSLQFGAGPAGVSVAGQPQARLVQIEQDILSKNDSLAADNRRRLMEARVLALNLVSSPGSGKTSLLVRTLEALKDRLSVAVVEGDQETSADANRIRATGAPALQVNTGKGCHLDASMVGAAMDHLAVPEGGVLFIENVGNLVCPAGFDLGEAHKVVVVSVTEGEDKPLKYPGMFAVSDLMVINKCDLLPHLDFDVDALIANARKVRPDIGVIKLSSTTGEGFEAWLAWIEAARAMRVIAAAE